MKGLINRLLYKRSCCNNRYIKKLLSILTVPFFNLKGSYIGSGAKFANFPVFPHGITGIFISGGAEIGKECVIFHQVTIGSNTIKGSKQYGSPRIGNNVYIGAGAKIIGNVSVGDNCRIGANCVVVKDVPANSTVVLPAPRIMTKDHIQNNSFYMLEK